MIVHALCAWLFGRYVFASAVEYIPMERSLLVDSMGQTLQLDSGEAESHRNVNEQHLMRSALEQPAASLEDGDEDMVPDHSSGRGKNIGPGGSDPYYSSGYAAKHGGQSGSMTFHSTDASGNSGSVTIRGPHAHQFAKRTQTHGPPGSCQIPMWAETDYVCSEHVDPDHVWKDADGIKRKFVENKVECTVACPKGQSWMSPDVAKMTCAEGTWAYPGDDEKAVKQINCQTARKVYVITALFLVLVAAFGYYCNSYWSQRKHQDAAVNQQYYGEQALHPDNQQHGHATHNDNQQEQHF